MNGYPSFYPRIALVAPSPGVLFIAISLQRSKRTPLGVVIIADRKVHGKTHVCYNGLLTRYVKLRIAHAPVMSGRFSLSLTSTETTSYRPWHASQYVHHTPAVMHVRIAIPQWQRKCSWHSRHIRNPQFYVSSKRPILRIWLHETFTYKKTAWISIVPMCIFSWVKLSIAVCYLIEWFWYCYWLLSILLQVWVGVARQKVYIFSWCQTDSSWSS